MSIYPLSFGFSGTLRIANGLLFVDAGDFGVVPLLKKAALAGVLREAGLPKTTELGGEQATLIVTVPGIEVEK